MLNIFKKLHNLFNSEKYYVLEFGHILVEEQKNDFLFKPINDLIYQIENTKNLLMKIDNKEICTINKLLLFLYKAYKSQLVYLKEIEKKQNPKIFIEEFIQKNKNIIRKILIYDLCFKKKTDCLYSKKSPNSRFLENLYLITIPKELNKNKENNQEEKIRRVLEENVQQINIVSFGKKLILYNSIIITILNYTNISKKIFKINKNNTDNNKNNLINLMTKFDIDIKQYQHITPVISTYGTIESGNNLVFFIESKFDLEVINNYILEKIKPNSKLFIICETGEWAINKLKLKRTEKELLTNNNKKYIEIYFLSSNYNCLENKNNKENNKIYHNIRYKNCIEKVIDNNNTNVQLVTMQYNNRQFIAKFHYKYQNFCLNDLHATILIENDKKEDKENAEGIIFYRALKSSIISPIFFKTDNLKEYFPGIKYLLESIEKTEKITQYKV